MKICFIASRASTHLVFRKTIAKYRLRKIALYLVCLLREAKIRRLKNAGCTVAGSHDSVDGSIKRE